MRHILTRRTTGLCLAACLAQPLAAEPLFSLQFTFPDAARDFAPVPGRAGITRFMILDAISFEGAAGPSRLVVQLALPPEATRATSPVDARITYRPDGFTAYWETPDIPPPGAIRFTTLALDGPQARIAGTFAVTLCHRASVLHPADPARCAEATGRFDMELQHD